MNKDQNASSPIVTVKGLKKAFGRKIVLDGIDLEVERGRILGYIGPNGAGKTTTVRILIGMLGGFGGKVEVCGYNVAIDPLEVKRRVGFVPETAQMYDALTPMEFLRFIGRLHRLKDREIEHRTRKMLGQLGLSREIGKRMSTFSKGMRQKVLIVAGLIHNPDLIIMDEPLSGLDANTAVVVKEVLAGLAARGKTIFYCSHVMDVVERICDRIVIISGGRIIADGSFEELQAMNKAASLESLFTQLTSEGGQEAVADSFIHSFDNGGSGDG
jgi:ABC-2 type transport system ATP-binding protein